MSDRPHDLPAWLEAEERYQPATDRDGFVVASARKISSVLARFRLDDGRSGRLSPSAPLKLLLGVGTILLVSLARNYLFVLLMLAGVLVRACLLPTGALRRTMGAATAAAALAAIVMLPAVLIGQPRSALVLATKAFVSTGVALTVTLTTPAAETTGALAALGMPDIAILTIELALRGIVQLGTTACEALDALLLRSVGRNRDKRTALGGVGGVVLIRAARSSHDTLDAMRCRGFEGSYRRAVRHPTRLVDLAWVLAFALVVALFLNLQGAR